MVRVYLILLGLFGDGLLRLSEAPRWNCMRFSNLLLFFLFFPNYLWRGGGGGEGGGGGGKDEEKR